MASTSIPAQINFNATTFTPPLASARTSIEPPPTDWHLTEPLVKPLHKFSESELVGLVHELQQRGYDKRERAIMDLTRKMVMQLFSLRQSSAPSNAAGLTPATYVETDYVMQRDGGGPGYRRHLRIRVALPNWLPDQYVAPFTERMIRDQIEEDG